MSHHTVHICAEHHRVQRRCKCPAPITTVITEPCKHGELTDQSLFWDGTTIVRGNPAMKKPEKAPLVSGGMTLTWDQGDVDIRPTGGGGMVRLQRADLPAIIAWLQETP